MESTINQQTKGLQVFYNEEMNVNVRTRIINDESWFVGKDVCNALGFANHKDALSRLDSDERDGVGITDPMGRSQEVTVINESGLYHLIFQSRKPEARAFRKWVTNDVLPSIRRTGSYSSTGIRPAGQPDRAKLPLPKHRPFFENWKAYVHPYLSSMEGLAVAKALDVSYSHVRKVFLGTSVSERVARALTEKAMENKRRGVKYEEAKPVFEQLSIEWEREDTEC
ncbi:Bro-N domain-containing protein [Bacteroides cellulosilyticus]|uniref:Bro-N domain-containing protein n=1 Tax=Bacteroides cellulosilyticus TaxID=246787 RepID=UPI0034A21CE6